MSPLRQPLVLRWLHDRAINASKRHDELLETRWSHGAGCPHAQWLARLCITMNRRDCCKPQPAARLRCEGGIAFSGDQCPLCTELCVTTQENAKPEREEVRLGFNAVISDGRFDRCHLDVPGGLLGCVKSLSWGVFCECNNPSKK